MMLVNETNREASEAYFPAKVLGTRTEADGVLSLSLCNAAGLPLPNWQPGAHIDVLLPNSIIRQYSLCGDPEDAATWRIAVLRDPSSRGGSAFIHESVKEGTEVLVAGPRNNFPLLEANRYLFIAGGIGITPILPMIRQVAAGGRPWALLYGGRTRNSMAFLDEVRSYPGGAVHIVPHDEFGLIDLPSAMSQMLPDTAVYCCGPSPLISAVEDACQTWKPAGFYRELFKPAQSENDGASDGPFDVKLARSGRTITVAEDQGLLDALEEAGCSVTNSCRAGICGTCLLNVLEGIPEHNDYLLSDAQRAAGNLILPCVSRSKSKVLVLDI